MAKRPRDRVVTTQKHAVESRGLLRVTGILTRLLFRDTDRHNLPHFHAEYQGKRAAYAIADGLGLAGSLPPNKHKLVVAWIEIHRDELLADWELAVSALPNFRIKGLEQ